MSEEPFIIDAANLVLGRVASVAAKRALSGDRVVVVNVEKAVITGRRLGIVDEARRFLRTRTHGSQEKAPKHPRRPDTYARRVMRGMLPWKKPKGKAAFRRIRVHMGVPGEYSSKLMHRIEHAKASRLRCTYVTLEELSQEIGGRAE